MKLSIRLGLAMVCLAGLAALAVGWAMLRRLDSVLLPAEREKLLLRAEQMAANLDAVPRAARSDMVALSQAPSLAALVHAIQASAAHPRFGLDADLAARMFAGRLTGHLLAKEEYSQIRLIGASDDGRELIRVDRSGDGGSIRVVPPEELQSNGSRAYFREAMALQTGGVYTSPLELNEEHGRIETPHLPVIRVATPIDGPDGKRFGILIVNLDMRAALDRFRGSAGPGDALYLVDGKGEYLVHPDRSLEFARVLGRARRAPSEYAGLAEVLGSETSGTIGTTTSSGEEAYVAVAPLETAGGPWIGVVVAVRADDLLIGAAQVRRASVEGGFAALLLAIALAVFLARSMAGPLARMTAAVETFAATGELPEPPRPGGEIGALADAFSRMAANLKEKELAMAEKTARDRLLSAFVESTDDAIITISPDRLITSWNPAAEELIGYAPEEALGRDINATIPEEFREAANLSLERILRGEKLEQRESLRRHRRGDLIDVSVSMSPVFSADGEIVGASTILRDVRGQKLAEQKFRLAVEASPSGIAMVDESGAIVLVNAETVRLFGYEREELIGASIEMLVPDRFRAEHPELRLNYQRKPERRAMGMGRDLYGRRKDGTEFPVEIGLNPIATAEGTLVLSVIADITERKAAEEAIAKYTEELKRSNAELEQFAYVASHDLQEPLRMVVSFSELLSQRYRGKLDERADKYINYMVEGGKRMQQLVADLLLYSRVGTQGKSLVPTDSGAALDSALLGLRKAIADAGGRVEVARAMPWVMADEGQLRQLFQNLIGNALKFRRDETPVVRVDAKRMGGSWIVAVRDNGIGIDSKFSDRIFQMFQRLHERGRYEGSGIGLSIAKRIVERHGGRIWFESVVGVGTVFHFTLAAAEPQ